MLGILVDAAILGLIIAVMERGEWPGWAPGAIVVLMVWATNLVLSFALPEEAWLVGVLASAVVAVGAIAWQFEMSLKRSAIAAGIYLGVKILWSLAIHAMIA